MRRSNQLMREKIMAYLIPDRRIRLLITGLVFAGSGSLFAISPLGKLTDTTS